MTPHISFSRCFALPTFHDINLPALFFFTLSLEGEHFILFVRNPILSHMPCNAKHYTHNTIYQFLYLQHSIQRAHLNFF